MTFEVCKFGLGVYKTCPFCGSWQGDQYCGIAKGKLEDVKTKSLTKCPLQDASR